MQHLTGEGGALIMIHASATHAHSPPMQDMHARFEPLLLFFIDGASLVEKGDDKWEALIAVQPTPAGNLTVRAV